MIPVTTEEYGESKARRPRNSRLSSGKIGKLGFELLENVSVTLINYLYHSGI